MNVAEKEIAIKSTKHFGQLLLLETKDWDNKGRYIPNKSQKGESFDFIVLVRIKPSFEEILKKERLLFSNHIDRDLLHTLATRDLWEYNYVGYITHTDLLEIIKRKHIVPKNGLLNGSTPMDTENYYVQAADMRDMSTFEAVF